MKVTRTSEQCGRRCASERRQSKNLQGLDGAARKLCVKERNLKESPEQRRAPLGSRATGDLTTFRKLVVGDRRLRIIYRVEGGNTVVVVCVIAQRSDDRCYEIARARLETARTGRAQHGDLQAILDLAFDKTISPPGNPGPA